MQTRVKHFENLHRFEVYVEGHTAYLTYVLDEQGIDINHTLVPRPISGRGIASALVEAAYRYSLEKGLKCRATCPYARTWLYENSSYELCPKNSGTAFAK